MKKIYSILMIAATLTIMWGCSKSDDDDNNNGGTNNSGDIHGVRLIGHSIRAFLRVTSRENPIGMR